MASMASTKPTPRLRAENGAANGWTYAFQRVGARARVAAQAIRQEARRHDQLFGDVVAQIADDLAAGGFPVARGAVAVAVVVAEGVEDGHVVAADAASVAYSHSIDR